MRAGWDCTGHLPGAGVPHLGLCVPTDLAQQPGCVEGCWLQCMLAAVPSRWQGAEAESVVYVYG